MDQARVFRKAGGAGPAWFSDRFPYRPASAAVHVLCRLQAGMKWSRASICRKPLVSLGITTGAIKPIALTQRGTCVAHSQRISYIKSGNRGPPMTAQPPLDDVLRRVQGEYIEMPGLRLTTAQAQRLWGLDRAACDALLGALVDAKFLFRTRDGAFMRSDQTRAVRT